MSTAEKKNIVSWSHKTPKGTIQSHFKNFFATIFPSDLMESLSLFLFTPESEKTEKTLVTSIAQEAFALAHFPRQKTGANLFNHGGFFGFWVKLKSKSICLFRGILSTFTKLICIDFEESYRRNFGVEYQCVSNIQRRVLNHSFQVAVGVPADLILQDGWCFAESTLSCT